MRKATIPPTKAEGGAVRRFNLLACLFLVLLAAVAPAQEAAVESPTAPPETAEPAELESAVQAEPSEAEAPEADPNEDKPADAAPSDEVEIPAEKPADDADADAADEGDEDEGDDEEAAPGTDWGGLISRAPEFLMLTHHAAVHLPIALWLFGAMFVVIGVVAPSWRTQVPLACLIGGALTSVAAAASGWWYAQFSYGDEWAWGDMVDSERLAEGIVRHRWLAVALVLASVVLSVIAIVNQRKQSRGLGFVWRFGLILLALGVAYEGHVGGELIMGEGFLEEAFEAWVNPEE